MLASARTERVVAQSRGGKQPRMIRRGLDASYILAGWRTGLSPHHGDAAGAAPLFAAQRHQRRPVRGLIHGGRRLSRPRPPELTDGFHSYMHDPSRPTEGCVAQRGFVRVGSGGRLGGERVPARRRVKARRLFGMEARAVNRRGRSPAS